MSAITKISARAKQIRRKHPGKSWKACIKAASAEYRAGLNATKPGEQGPKELSVLKEPAKELLRVPL
jgi:hypothetical protein